MLISDFVRTTRSEKNSITCGLWSETAKRKRPVSASIVARVLRTDNLLWEISAQKGGSTARKWKKRNEEMGETDTGKITSNIGRFSHFQMRRKPSWKLRIRHENMEKEQFTPTVAHFLCFALHTAFLWLVWIYPSVENATLQCGSWMFFTFSCLFFTETCVETSFSR